MNRTVDGIGSRRIKGPNLHALAVHLEVVEGGSTLDLILVFGNRTILGLALLRAVFNHTANS